ncbi:MAG: nucleoside-triphosphatase [Candidatus Omnitrophica bacterium]|nr:nucleoside-triphosphatase [Candidatus Omnitrophota bacterium]
MSGLNLKKGGFFTEELRKEGRRVGFNIVTLSGKETILAHKYFDTPYKVSIYSVSIENLEAIAVKEIEESIKSDCLIVIDEIGKMEIFSTKFRKAVIDAIESKNNLLATIMLKPDPFCNEIKRRTDVRLFLLKRHNYNTLKEQLIALLQ